MKNTEAYVRLVDLYVKWATLWSLHFNTTWDDDVETTCPNGHPDCVAAKAKVFDTIGVLLREAGFSIRTHEIHGSFYWHIIVKGTHVASVALGTPDNDIMVFIFDELRADAWEPPKIELLADAPAIIRRRLAQRASDMKAQADKITRLSQALEQESSKP